MQYCNVYALKAIQYLLVYGSVDWFIGGSVLYVCHLQHMDVFHDGTESWVLCDASDSLHHLPHNPLLLLAAVSIVGIVLGDALSTMAPVINNYFQYVIIIVFAVLIFISYNR